MQSDTLKRLNAFMKGVGNDDNQRDLLGKMQESLDYALEKIRIYEEIFVEKLGESKPKLSDGQKRRLANKAATLNQYILATVENTFSPDTIRGWYRELVGRKYDSTKAENAKKRGRKPVSDEIVQNILRFAKNSDWGYERIASYMVYLGFKVSATTVRKVLDDHGIVPNPEQRRRGDWEQFINSHKDVIAATDFVTVELLTPNGLVREHVLFFEDITTREVRLGGIIHAPDGNWMKQVARNMTDAWDGFLIGKKYLIHDRDPLFTADFAMIMKSAGVKCKKLPPRSPNLNSYLESFIKSCKSECLDKLILTSEAQLRYSISEYLEFYHRERPHRGLGGKMINPWPQDEDGEIIEFSRLGGLLKSYRRVKKAA